MQALFSVYHDILGCLLFLEYNINYPHEVSSMKYCCLGVFRKGYFRLVTK